MRKKSFSQRRMMAGGGGHRLLFEARRKIVTEQEFCIVRNTRHLNLSVLWFVSDREKKRKLRKEEKKGEEKRNREKRRAVGRTRKFPELCGTQSLG